MGSTVVMGSETVHYLFTFLVLATADSNPALAGAWFPLRPVGDVGNGTLPE